MSAIFSLAKGACIGSNETVEAPMHRIVSSFWRDEQGQDLIEYSLLMTFIAIAVMAFVESGKGSIQGIWTASNSQVAAANSAIAGS
jgi:Flp pilus assembly pilin Flp